METDCFGEILAPKPQNAPPQVFTGAQMNLEVKPAQDWGGWLLARLDEGYVEDAPLTYKWTEDKDYFLVEDAQGNLTESNSASGLNAQWVAPDKIDTDKEDVQIKCTIDDAEGARVGTTDAGTRDDEKLERTVSVEVVQMKVTRIRVKPSSIFSRSIPGKTARFAIERFGCSPWRMCLSDRSKTVRYRLIVFDSSEPRHLLPDIR